jgi:putative tryptophan/tyrosine transport system substrate-binding protein
MRVGCIGRRDFIGGAAACLGSLPLANAQPSPPAATSGSRPARIALLSGARSDPRSPFLTALRLGLAEVGRVEDRDFRFEMHWGENSPERFDSLVADLLRTKPDVIVTQGPILYNVRRAGTELPIVFAFSGDPVAGGIVESWRRPGGNLTGISMMALELVGKRVEALTGVVPGLRRVAFISNPGHAGESSELAASQATAAKLGLEIRYLPVSVDRELDATLAQTLTSRSQAMVVFPDASMMLRSERFAEFGVRNGIPAVSGWAEFARRGNLMSYGPNVQQVYRRLASFIDRVLRGAKPAELPVELPTLIEHVINLRSARALGLTIPRAALLRADELIE